MIVETTLFSPWWFSGGTNQAFVEVKNNMLGPTNALVTLYRSDGTVCGTADVPLAGNGNAAIVVGSIGTCAGGSGSAQIAFAGTPGGLIANITTIDGPNGTSFDSPFAPRMVWAGSVADRRRCAPAGPVSQFRRACPPCRPNPP